MTVRELLEVIEMAREINAKLDVPVKAQGPDNEPLDLRSALWNTKTKEFTLGFSHPQPEPRPPFDPTKGPPITRTETYR